MRARCYRGASRFETTCLFVLALSACDKAILGVDFDNARPYEDAGPLPQDSPVDTPPPPKEVGPLPEAAPAEASVEAGVPLPPQDLRATTNHEDRVELTWREPQSGAPDYYELSAAHLDAAIQVAAASTAYTDRAAPGGTLTVELAASSDRVDGVALTYSSTAVASAGHSYTLTAVRGPLRSEPATALGERSAPTSTAAGVSLSVSDGPFVGIGDARPYVHTGAPAPLLSASSTSTEAFHRGVVLLRASVTETPRPVSYKLRVRTLSGDFESAPAVGVRASGAIGVQWQRGVAGADFTDLADVTGTSWYDPNPVVGLPRSYRVHVSSQAGESTSSTPTETTLPSVLAITAGGGYSCAIQEGTGSLSCWGAGFGPSPVDQGAGYAAVAAGLSHRCALRQGTSGLACFGSNNKGQAPGSIAGAYNALGVGYGHTCGLRTDARLLCLGDNEYGQAPPELQTSSTTYNGLGVGPLVTCGIRSDHTLHCFGRDGSDQIAHTPTSTPFQLVAPGYGNTCGITETGRLVCWGDKFTGLPLTESVDTYSDVALGRDSTVFACALRSDKKRLCFGKNTFGQAPAESPGPYIALAAGAAHSCALREDKRVECTGENGSDAVQPLPPAQRVTRVSASNGVHCVVGVDSIARCAGDNTSGAVSGVPGSSMFTEIAAGSSFSCGLLSDQSFVCWGVKPPILASARLDHFTAIDVGDSHVCALRTTGGVDCWGNVPDGLPSPPFETLDSLRLATEGNTACVIARAGGIICWGRNDKKQATPPTLPARPLAIAMGAAHGCVIQADKAIVCWGDDTFSQATGAPPGERFQVVACGANHTCGVLEDGRMRCWGKNDKGQAPTGPLADRFVSVAAGYDFTCGIREDGHLVCFGANDVGQAPRP